MERRGFEAPMDWEYQHQRALDHTSSPFATFSQKQPTSAFDSPSKLARGNANQFAAATRSPLKPDLRPPQSSMFNPNLQNRPLAPAFRNPAFTTPQKPVHEVPFSPAESSPAMTDTSEMPADTPDVDREEDGTEKLTITPSAGRTLFGKTLLRNHASGRGEIQSGNRDKIRKRKRLHTDRDVGSVRPRLPHDSDESDSDWREPQRSRTGVKASKTGKVPQRGWVGNFLAAVSDHPSAPAILSKWLQLGMNFVIVSLVVFGIFGIFTQIRSDLAHANEKARSAILNEMAVCADNLIKNNCSPRSARPPALDGPCNEWEICANQDPAAIISIKTSAQTVADILNAFVGKLTFKTWGFIMSLFMAVIVASNVGFGFLRESTLANTARPAEPLHSAPAAAPILESAARYQQPAFFLTPFTPRHMRKNYFADDATDTDNSPDFKAIMPPQTPSGRRSPSKGDRGRSPSKGSRVRSPSKGY
ncbi:hypothetical protein MFIFM68171_01747 [Madurella fahalii]|uniref:Brl1/Brr6 domain-containing protein n=1 Tax=Madurella fahalii TaxID=1157608 RepID=A0ABQ0G1B7_9PEZI